MAKVYRILPSTWKQEDHVFPTFAFDTLWRACVQCPPSSSTVFAEWTVPEGCPRSPLNSHVVMVPKIDGVRFLRNEEVEPLITGEFPLKTTTMVHLKNGILHGTAVGYDIRRNAIINQNWHQGGLNLELRRAFPEDQRDIHDPLLDDSSDESGDEDPRKDEGDKDSGEDEGAGTDSDVATSTHSDSEEEEKEERKPPQKDNVFLYSWMIGTLLGFVVLFAIRVGPTLIPH